MRDADLLGTVLDSAQLTGARIDLLTFEKSGLTADDLVSMRERGAKIVGLDAFPESVRARFLSSQEGLTLCFHLGLDRFDRMLIEGTIVGVLGRGTDCDIAEFRNFAQGSVVRLVARKRADLEHVAEALYRKVWEAEQSRAEEVAQKIAQVEGRALVRWLDLLQSPQLRDGLSNLRGRLDTMELRAADMPSADPAALMVASRNPIQLSEAAVLRWRLRLKSEDLSGAQYEIRRPQRVLLHHAEEDSAFAATLRRHLSSLVREGLADLMTPPLPGATIKETQERQLHEADAVLALVSADYLATDDCVKFFDQAQNRPRGGLHIVPVLVRPAVLEGTLLYGRVPLPEDGFAVTEWPNQDAAWKNITNGLRMVLRSSL